MKYLKIETDKAAFSVNGTDWKDLTTLDRDSLLFLINKAMEEGFTMDAYISGIIKNPADDIIYKNIYTKLNELMENRSKFRDESAQIYAEALKKYQVSK